MSHTLQNPLATSKRSGCSSSSGSSNSGSSGSGGGANNNKTTKAWKSIFNSGSTNGGGGVTKSTKKSSANGQDKLTLPPEVEEEIKRAKVHKNTLLTAISTSNVQTSKTWFYKLPAARFSRSNQI